MFIVFDAYNRFNPETLDSTLLLTADLIAKGMLVEKFDYYEDFKNWGREAGLKIVYDEDITPFVFPTVERFEKLVGTLLKFPFLVKILQRLLPAPFINNGISGYLMTDSIKLNIAIYAITAFKA